ncbi:MAG: CcmD family protein [Ignavibacteriales bacterium]|nr:CcmD family protein [Ignavibacteriales bacterium]
MLEFMSQNQMYIVLAIVLLVWMGIVAYLLRLDRKVKDLERTMKKES